jgi:hypothetical protein
MKKTKTIAWVMAVLAISIMQSRAELLIYNGGADSYDLENYAVGSTFQDASQAYIADATKFAGTFGSWHKNDSSDSAYFHGAKSWEWNTTAEGPQEVAWTLTGLTAGEHYKLSIVGLLNETIPSSGAGYSDTRYINVGIESGNLNHYFYTNLTDSVSSLPAGAVKAYDGTNAKYGSYIIPFADDIVADAGGEFTVYFAADAGVRTANNFRSYVDGVVVSPIPEPTTLSLVMVLGGGIFFIRRRRYCDCR